jgi:hypothetical protein
MQEFFIIGLLDRHLHISSQEIIAVFSRKRNTDLFAARLKTMEIIYRKN